MPGILSALIGNHFAKEREKREAQINLYGPIAHEYLTKPDSAIDPKVGEYAVQSVGKLLPKEEQKRFTAWVDTMNHGKQLSDAQAKLGESNQGTPRFVSAMASPGIPPPPSVEPNLASPILSMNQAVPPPPTEPLPASGQASSGPAVPSDTQAPPAGPSISSAPSAGFTSLTPPPGMLRNGPSLRALSPIDLYQSQQAPIARAQAQMAQELTQRMHQWLTAPKEEGGGGLNAVQAADYLNKHQVQYEPTTVLKPGEEQRGVSGQLLATGQPRITTTAAGGVSTLVPNAGVPPPPGKEGQSNTIAAPPPLPSKRAIEAKSSYTAFRQSTDPTYKWSENDLPKAEAYFKESSMSPTERLQKDLSLANLKEVRINNQLRQQEMNQHIREFNQTKGPEAIDAMADQIYANPETQKKLTGDLYNLVAQRYTQKYALPMPRDLPANVQTQEEASKVSLNHIDAIRELLKNQVIQKRLGAFSGRVGNLEQELGTTVGLSSADAQAIQNFRTRIPYLFGQEARALFGARPPQKFMDDLKAASPNMKKGMPLFLGALDAAEAMGKLNVITAEQSRNGGKVRPEIQQQYGMSAPPGTNAAPPPPKIGEVRDGHRFKGGNPGLQSNWEKVI